MSYYPVRFGKRGVRIMYHSDLHEEQLELVAGAAKIQRGPLYLARGATDGVDQNAYLR